jgi:hypothetical protein
MNVGAKIMLTGKRRLPAGAQAPTCHVRMPDGWSANRKCALSSALFRRVEVPLALK